MKLCMGKQCILAELAIFLYDPSFSIFLYFGDTFVIIVLNHCSKLGKTLLCCMTIAGKMPEIARNEKK